MHGHAGRHILKVDCTSLNFDSEDIHRRDELMVFYNVNIPAAIIINNQEKRAVLERVKNLLIRDFDQADIVYQICASYFLRHTETNQEIIWTGSFFARNNNPSRLLSFQVFDPNQFVDICFEATENVDDKLRYNNFDTKWKYDRLISVIINIQAEVSRDHPVLRKRNLQYDERRHTTFSLP